MNSTGKHLFGRPAWRWWAIGLAALLVYAALTQQVPARAYFWLKFAIAQPASTDVGLGLAQYRVLIEAKPVEGVAGNLSGLSYDNDRRQIWAVINNPPQLLAMSTTGEVLSRHDLDGFEDVEAVAYLGEGWLALADERRQELIALPCPKAPGPLRRADYRSLRLDIGNSKQENNGFEGLGYDRRGDRLFVVKEQAPRRLYEIRGFKASLQGDYNLQVIDHDDWIRQRSFVSDLSSVEFDPGSGHLLLLSDLTRMVLELDANGAPVGYRSLWSTAGLKRSVKQAEGLTLDDNGRLYLVSEPNLFYVFERQR